MADGKSEIEVRRRKALAKINSRRLAVQSDAYKHLCKMAAVIQPIPPELLIELSPLQGSVKQRALDILKHLPRDGEPA